MIRRLGERLWLHRGTALWMLGAAVLVHAALRRFVEKDGLVTGAWIGFALGALPALRGAGLRRWPVRILVGGLPLAVLSMGAILVLDEVGDSGTAVHAVALVLIAVAALVDGECWVRLAVLVGVEWLKLRRGRLLKWGFVVSVTAALLVGVTYNPVEEESGWSVATHLLGAGFWTAEILLLVLGATAVAGEIGQGTMKMVLPHAFRRAEWIAAKATVLVFAAALFAAGVVVASLAFAGFTHGLGDVIKIVPVGFTDDERQVFQSAALMRSHMTDAVLAASASLVASALLGLLLSSLFDSLVPALSASFLVFVGLKVGDILLGFSPDVLDAIYTQYPDELRNLTQRLGSGINAGWNEALLPDGIHLAMITAVLGLLAAMRLFARRDLHG